MENKELSFFAPENTLANMRCTLKYTTAYLQFSINNQF